MNAPILRAVEQGSYLGSARMVELGRALRVCVVQLANGERVEATLALGYPYEPVVGDELLVIGRGAEGYWVIGVVMGQGRVNLELDGDVRLHARNGTLTLSGDRGVRLRGPELDVLVDRFAVSAKDAIHKVTTMVQRVREMLHVHAGESQSVVDGTAVQRARKIAVIADETASVNGKQILLG